MTEPSIASCFWVTIFFTKLKKRGLPSHGTIRALRWQTVFLFFSVRSLWDFFLGWGLHTSNLHGHGIDSNEFGVTQSGRAQLSRLPAGRHLSVWKDQCTETAQEIQLQPQVAAANFAEKFGTFGQAQALKMAIQGQGGHVNTSKNMSKSNQGELKNPQANPAKRTCPLNKNTRVKPCPLLPLQPDRPQTRICP